MRCEPPAAAAFYGCFILLQMEMHLAHKQAPFIASSFLPVPSLWHRQMYIPGPCQRWGVHPAPTPPQRLTHLRLVVTALPGTCQAAKEDSPIDQLSQDMLHGVEQWQPQKQTHCFSFNTVRWEKYFPELLKKSKLCLDYTGSQLWSQNWTPASRSAMSAQYPPDTPFLFHRLKWTGNIQKSKFIPLQWPDTTQTDLFRDPKFVFYQRLQTTIIRYKALRWNMASVLQKCSQNASQD